MYVECLGVKAAARPGQRLLVLRVAGVLNRREERFVAAPAAAVLRRTCALPGETDRGPRLARRINRHHQYLVPPVIAEVVHIRQLGAHCRRHLPSVSFFSSSTSSPDSGSRTPTPRASTKKWCRCVSRQPITRWRTRCNLASVIVLGTSNRLQIAGRIPSSVIVRR